MQRRDFIGTMMAAGLTGGLLPTLGGAQPTSATQAATSRQRTPGQPPARPNFIVIMADDQGWGDLGCYGHPVLHTPCIDALAARSCRFTDFYVTSPVCAPSRAGLLTGRDQNRFGMKHLLNSGRFDSPLYHHMPLQEPTIPRLLQGAGYRTSHIGKWHISLIDEHGEPDPNDYGYDHYLVVDGPNPKSYYKNPYGWSLDGERTGKLADWSAQAYVDEAIRFVDAAGDEPFFMNLWSITPHEGALDAADQYKELYKHRTEREQLYFGAVTQMDEHYGRLLKHLEDKGLMDKTVIVYTSDNGPEHPLFPWGKRDQAGSTGCFRGAKRNLYDGGIRVPGIVHWPGLSIAGSTSSVPASTLDLMPSFCAAAGVAPPDGEQWPLDGGDLRPALQGEPIERAHALYWQYDLARDHANHGENFVSPPLAIREGEWKLLCEKDFSEPQLYHIDVDKPEQWNLAAYHPEIAEDLLDKLKAIHAEVNGPYSKTADYINPDFPLPEWYQGKDPRVYVPRPPDAPLTPAPAKTPAPTVIPTS